MRKEAAQTCAEGRVRPLRQDSGHAIWVGAGGPSPRQCPQFWFGDDLLHGYSPDKMQHITDFKCVWFIGYQLSLNKFVYKIGHLIG